jgi:hypothetical protein
VYTTLGPSRPPYPKGNGRPLSYRRHKELSRELLLALEVNPVSAPRGEEPRSQARNGV